MEQAWIQGLAGGVMIGVSASLVLVVLGRICGISGIFAGCLGNLPDSDGLWRYLFIGGLLAGPVVYHFLSGISVPEPSGAGWVLTIVAGFLVGLGTRIGGGCTSGHGVCGIGRLSVRSILATLTFMGSGIATVFVIRHLLA